MKKARFTETQIVNILKLADSGIESRRYLSPNGFHISRETVI